MKRPKGEQGMTAMVFNAISALLDYDVSNERHVKAIIELTVRVQTFEGNRIVTKHHCRTLEKIKEWILKSMTEIKTTAECYKCRLVGCETRNKKLQRAKRAKKVYAILRKMEVTKEWYGRKDEVGVDPVDADSDTSSHGGDSAPAVGGQNNGRNGGGVDPVNADANTNVKSEDLVPAEEDGKPLPPVARILFPDEPEEEEQTKGKAFAGVRKKEPKMPTRGANEKEDVGNENAMFDMTRTLDDEDGQNRTLWSSLSKACVARAVNRKEVSSNAKANQACLDEWARLDKVKCWNMEVVRERGELIRSNRGKQQNVHFGKLAEICVEKGSEVEEGNKGRKYKGRVVFLGDRVRDVNGNPAVFEELSSSPAALEAGKLVDLYGCLMMKTSGDSQADAGGKSNETKTTKFVIQQSDAVQAYTQASLKGDETWIELPKNRWPDEWKGMTTPMVQLKLALYGHPCSGAYWEERCENKVKKEGFRKLSEGGEWRSCYYHDKLKVLLAIYVDDFKMAGPEEACAAAWKLLQEGEGGIIMDEPTPISSYLGCTHKIHEITRDGVTITAIEYDMQGQLEQAIKVYKELAEVESLPEVPTPFLAEDDTPNPSKEPTHLGEGLMCPWCRSVYPEEAFEPFNNNEDGGRKREKEHVLKQGGSWPKECVGGTPGPAGAFEGL